MLRYYILKLPVNDPGWCQEIKGNNFNIDDYVPVWTSTIPEIEDKSIYDYLEELFKEFNLGHPKNYAASSMSIGDIIRIQHEDGNIKHYAVKGIGFKELKPIE